MTSDDAPGWYGKISAVGDFASRRLANDDVQWLDHWLSACLQASRQQLGERWMDVYLSAPLWRFVLGPGVMGDPWWCGVMMPSCDNVGRYFPLLVLQAHEQPPADAEGLDRVEQRWAHLAHAAQDTLAEGSSLAAFEAALHAAPAWPGAGVAPTAPTPPGPLFERLALAPQTPFTGVTLALAAQALRQRLQGHSLWWAMTSDAEPGAVTTVAGLPPPQVFAAMLQGRW